MLYLVKTMVEFCRVADLAWDPRKDILFLCQHYGEQVESPRSQLDQRTLKKNFLGTPFFSRLSPEDQRKCYQVLLGTEPPPMMAITPPAPSSHKHSASAPDVSSPRARTHNASSSLSSDRSPELLSPPIPSKPRPSLTASSTARHLLPQTQHSDSSAVRESRSRYRNVSAPTRQEISPVDMQSTTTNQRQHSQPPPMAYHTPLMTMSQNGSQTMYLPPHLAFNTSTQGTQSMPDLNAGLCGPAPSYTFNQMPPCATFGRLPQVTHNHISPVEMAASPVTASPGPQSTKSPAGVPAYTSQQQPIDNVSILSRPRPPRNKSPSKAPVGEVSVMDQPRPPRTKSVEVMSVRAELSGTPMPEERALQLHVVNPDVAEPVQHSQVATNQQSFFPVELDAMSELKQFIAELSVERSTPAPKSTASDLPKSFVVNRSIAQPISASLTSEPQAPLSDLHTMTDPHHEDIPIRPLKTRTTSATIGGLPTSLRPGGSTSHTRTTSTCSGAALPTTADTILHYTNASKYTNLTAPSTPPPSQPNSPRPSYIAYNPASTPALPNFMPLSPPASMTTSSVPTSTTSSIYKDGQDSPADSPMSPEIPERQNRFSTLVDVDGAGGYFKDKHKRDKSADTRALAMEYQAELPVFGEGYWKISLDFEGERRT